ncbi:MAG: hypothetical protein R2881_05865 [Eubacteriales bacterium]
MGDYLARVDKQQPAEPEIRESVSGGTVVLTLTLQTDPGGSGNDKLTPGWHDGQSDRNADLCRHKERQLYLHTDGYRGQPQGVYVRGQQGGHHEACDHPRLRCIPHRNHDAGRDLRDTDVYRRGDPPSPTADI